MAYSDLPLEEIRPEQGLTPESPAEELYRAGLAYSSGAGVEMDLVAAHKWFNLAAMAGNEEARTARREMAEMLSSDEIAEALKSAREWLSLAN